MLLSAFLLYLSVGVGVSPAFPASSPPLSLNRSPGIATDDGPLVFDTQLRALHAQLDRRTPSISGMGEVRLDPRGLARLGHGIEARIDVFTDGRTASAILVRSQSAP